MRTSNILPVDAIALARCLRLKGLTLEKASRDMGFSKPYISNVIHRKTITQSGAMLMEQIHGIKYEDYKPEEPKPEPKEEPKPIPETVITDKYEQHLKAILFQLANVNNNLVALAKIIAKIDEDIKVWECDD